MTENHGIPNYPVIIQVGVAKDAKGSYKIWIPQDVIRMPSVECMQIKFMIVQDAPCQFKFPKNPKDGIVPAGDREAFFKCFKDFTLSDDRQSLCMMDSNAHKCDYGYKVKLESGSDQYIVSTDPVIKNRSDG